MSAELSHTTSHLVAPLAKWTARLPTLIAFSALARQCFLLSKTRMAPVLDVSKGAALLSLPNLRVAKEGQERFCGSVVIEQKGDPLGSGMLPLAEFADFCPLCPDMNFQASHLTKRSCLDHASSFPHHQRLLDWNCLILCR